MFGYAATSNHIHRIRKDNFISIPLFYSSLLKQLLPSFDLLLQGQFKNFPRFETARDHVFCFTGLPNL